MPCGKETRKELLVRMSPEEHAKLRALCAATHRTATSLMRALIHRAEVVPEPPLYVERQPPRRARRA